MVLYLPFKTNGFLNKTSVRNTPMGSNSKMIFKCTIQLGITLDFQIMLFFSTLQDSVMKCNSSYSMSTPLNSPAAGGESELNRNYKSSYITFYHVHTQTVCTLYKVLPESTE